MAGSGRRADRARASLWRVLPLIIARAETILHRLTKLAQHLGLLGVSFLPLGARDQEANIDQGAPERLGHGLFDGLGNGEGKGLELA